MRATRLGRVFCADDGPAWMVSHAAYPTPVLLADGGLRVFFNTRDADNRGCLAWIDLDRRDPRRVLALSETPALTYGAFGAFDDRGLSNGSIHHVGKALWLYYMGWTKAAEVPFRNSIGLAVSRDDTATKFERRFEGPLIGCNRYDPFTVSYPFVIPPADDGPWHMYYGSSRAGGANEEAMQHVITEAVSSDGIDWRPTGRDVIGLAPGEFGLSRPWCMNVAGQAQMLFSIRRALYRIGMAALEAGSGAWRRTCGDLLGPSNDAWDSEATCYPAVIEVDGTRYMFYCGNGYGRTGFGLAILED